MIEEQVRVVKSYGNQVAVQSVRRTACGSCKAKQGCGQKALIEWSESNLAQLSVSNPSNIFVKAGDQVIIGLDEGSMIKASALVYVVPLLSLFVAGLGAQQASLSEPGVVGVALSGLLLGFLAAKKIGKTLAAQAGYQPVLLRISS